MKVTDDLVEQLGKLVSQKSELVAKEADLWRSLATLLHNIGRFETEADRTRPTSAPGPSKEHFPAPEAAEFLGIKEGTLAKWRLSGDGPPFIKVGRRILYKRSVLEQFLQERTFPHTSAYHAKQHR